MAKITEIRLTLAAFIYGIEIDLKNVIKKHITPFQENINFLQDPELVSKVIDRYKKDNDTSEPSRNVDDLIDYSDKRGYSPSTVNRLRCDEIALLYQ